MTLLLTLTQIIKKSKNGFRYYQKINNHLSLLKKFSKNKIFSVLNIPNLLFKFYHIVSIKSNEKKSNLSWRSFRQHQYLYMLPIIDSFCKKNKINTIIIERKLIKKTFTHPMINKIKKRYNIVYLPDLIKRNKVEFKINLFFVLIYFFLKYFFIKGKNLREKDTWISTQIKHSIWDFAIKINKDKFDSLELLPRLKSIYYSSLYYCYSLLLLKYYKIDFSFFQHFVYFERTLFANLRRKKVTLIQKSFHVLRVKKKYDLSSNYLDKIYKNSFKFKKEKFKIIEEYLSGRSKYLRLNNKRDKE